MKPLLPALKEADLTDVKFWVSVLVRVAAVVLAEPGVIEILARDFFLGVALIPKAPVVSVFSRLLAPITVALVIVTSYIFVSRVFFPLGKTLVAAFYLLG